MTLYREQLKRVGATYVLPFRMGDDARDRTLYYLMHATKHVKGVKIMKDVMVASGSPGLLGYAGQVRHQMLPLFDFHIDDLPSVLQHKFTGQTLTFDQIVERTIEETGTCREADYRTRLKELEREGQIAVQRVTSTRLNGLSGKDLISFPAEQSSIPGGSNFGR